MSDRPSSKAMIGSEIRDRLREHARGDPDRQGLNSILILLVLLGAVACLFLVGRFGR